MLTWLKFMKSAVFLGLNLNIYAIHFKNKKVKNFDFTSNFPTRSLSLAERNGRRRVISLLHAKINVQ